MNYSIKTKTIAKSEPYTQVDPLTGIEVPHVLIIAELEDADNVIGGSYFVSVTDAESENIQGPIAFYKTEEQAWMKYNALLKAVEAKNIKLEGGE
jgi:hypothetical protein